MNFFDHKDLGNHLLQLCPQVVKHPVYIHSIYIYIYMIRRSWSQVCIRLQGLYSCQFMLDEKWYKRNDCSYLMAFAYTVQFLSLYTIEKICFIILCWLLSGSCKSKHRMSHWQRVLNGWLLQQVKDFGGLWCPYSSAHKIEILKASLAQYVICFFFP
jgi:hypothetical protein